MQAVQRYIQLNTLKRQEAKNKFEENFCKLMNNCYGKTLESKRKRVNLHLMRSEEEVKSRTSNDLFQEFKIILWWKIKIDCRLLYAETDSLLYETKGKDF